jgi:hypothetical protein
MAMKKLLSTLVMLSLMPLMTARAQPAGAGEAPAGGNTNKRLKIQLDRTTARPFEPLYLCVSAEQFALGEIQVAVRREGESTWRAITIKPKDWVKSEVPSAVGVLPLQRRGTVLQDENVNGNHKWLFPTPGKYLLRVAVGPDAPTLPPITITAPEPGEMEAWESLGDRIGDVLEVPFNDEPDQGTIDACRKVITKFPKSRCAAYCQAYISISVFKASFEKNGKAGGKAAYEGIAQDLTRISASFKDNYYGEMTGFYAAYAAGLAKHFDAVIEIADAMQTHLTPWSDAMTAMRLEVMSHLGPRVVPVDPDRPLTTQPTTAPGK